MGEAKIKSIKREIWIIVIGLLLIAGIICLSLFYNPSFVEPYRHNFIASWRDLHHDVLQFQILANKEGVNHSELIELHKQIANKIEVLREESRTLEEKELMDTVSPYLEQIIEYVGTAIKMSRERKQEKFHEALANIGFTLEEIAKITTDNYRE